MQSCDFLNKRRYRNVDTLSETCIAHVRCWTTAPEGAGGPLERGVTLAVVDFAVYYLRHSAFVPSRIADQEVKAEIPGDNAAYPRMSFTEE